MWDSIISNITEVNNWLNGFVWGWPMIILILGTGILLTIKTRFIQIRKFKNSIRTTIVPALKELGKNKRKDKTAHSVSQFEAFSTAISGTVGTGNIIGVASAILTGGPGAVVWMWISAFFGMITNFSENVLGLYYRKKNKKGEFSGGSFYYITYGIKQKWLGYLSAIFCLFAAIGMSRIQTNKITSTMATAFNFSDSIKGKLMVGGIVALLTFIVVIGGIKRIGKIAAMLVPFMSLIFIAMSVIIIFVNIEVLPETFKIIFGSMFSVKAVSGGAGGFVFSQIIKKGLARGVFSNEAGLGSSVIAHSASETREPVVQGLWGIFEVFFDTFVICTLTAFVILTTYIQNGMYMTEEFWSLEDSVISLGAFTSNFGFFGTAVFCAVMPLFAFTTIIAWSYYGEKATEFFFGWLPNTGQKVAITIFKLIYIALNITAGIIHSDLIWALEDTFNGLMALPNLIALVLLSGQLVKIVKNYYDRKKGKDVLPMLSAYPEQNDQFIKDITE